MASPGEDVPYEVEDDGGMLFNVQRMRSGGLTGQVRVWGRVEIEGKLYEYDRAEVRVALRPVKD